jgi:hypothetical protein
MRVARPTERQRAGRPAAGSCGRRSSCTAPAAGRAAPRTCGSDYDAFGNPRFASALVMSAEDSAAALQAGLVSFDSFGAAWLLLYQCLTQEGWSELMYWFMDATQPALAAARSAGIAPTDSRRTTRSGALRLNTATPL